MFGIGPQELLLILVIALIVVGPRKLPEMARTIGKGLREVRKAQDEVRRTIQVDLDDEPASATPSAGPPPAPVDGDAAELDAGESAASGSDLSSSGAATASVADVSRTLGRGLAELRKAREEIQRTFRVDLGDVSGASPGRRPSGAGRPSAGGGEGADAPSDPTPEPRADSAEESDPGRAARPAE
jgi:Tat protein translocase TatB subunit